MVGLIGVGRGVVDALRGEVVCFEGGVRFE